MQTKRHTGVIKFKYVAPNGLVYWKKVDFDTFREAATYLAERAMGLLDIDLYFAWTPVELISSVRRKGHKTKQKKIKLGGDE